MNKGYGDAGASWHKKATKGFRAMSGSPKEDIDANNYTLRQRARMLYMAAPIATSAIRDVYKRQASALQAEGHRFEPCRSHPFKGINQIWRGGSTG